MGRFIQYVEAFMEGKIRRRVMEGMGEVRELICLDIELKLSI